MPAVRRTGLHFSGEISHASTRLRAPSLASLATWLRDTGRHLLVSGVSGDAEKILERSGVDRIVGRENIFFSKAGILHSTRDALLFAEQIVGAGGAEVRIFHDRPEEEFGSAGTPLPPPEEPAGAGSADDPA